MTLIEYILHTHNVLADGIFLKILRNCPKKVGYLLVDPKISPLRFGWSKGPISPFRLAFIGSS
jgi:hypothetical protein